MGDVFRKRYPRDSYLRDPHWVLQTRKDKHMVLLTPFEVNALYDQMKEMEHAVLFQFQPQLHSPSSSSLTALHEMRGFSVPAGHVLHFSGPAQFGGLSLFSGNLYFRNVQQERSLSLYLGYYFVSSN